MKMAELVSSPPAHPAGFLHALLECGHGGEPLPIASFAAKWHRPCASRNARNRLVTIVWLIAGIVEVAVGLPMFFMGRWLRECSVHFFPSRFSSPLPEWVSLRPGS